MSGTAASQQGELLKLHLQGTYTSHRLPGLKIALAAGHDEDIAREVEGVVALEDIEFTGVGVKGLGSRVIARVTIRVAGAPPPDGRPVRYFRLEHSAITGWIVKRETNALAYYLKIF